MQHGMTTLWRPENKELQGKGGIIGLTVRGNALLRWFLSLPVTAYYSATVKATCQ